MQIVAVDIGNSATKLLVGEDQRRLTHHAGGLSADFADTLAKQIDASRPAFWYVSSVNDSQCQQLEAWVKRNRSEDRFFIITREQVPLKVVESYRQTVGIDRIVAAYAAVSAEDSNVPLIIVDAGTAVTIDVVSIGWDDEERRFEGGVIFPGVGASLSALNSATASLPDVSLSAARLSESDAVDAIDGIVGTHTDMAIANGVRLAQAHAVAGIVGDLEKRLANAKVLVTGGGADDILSTLPSTITNVWHADAHLVSRGAALIGQLTLSNDSLQ